jgi:ribosomal protein S18 acetylase RimI-like enzyme
VAEGIEEERITAALVALSSYRADVVIDRVQVLEEQPSRSWVPLADYPLAPPAVVGRGGLPLELAISDMPDPEAAPTTFTRFSITARRDGAVVGSVTVGLSDGAAELISLEVDLSCRREGIGTHLLAAACSEAAARGATDMTAPLLARFLSDRGWAADADGGYARRKL